MQHTVGVLALQGAYQKHIDMLTKLGVKTRQVRLASELEQCTSLIIPGGESTSISLLIQKNKLNHAIQRFAKKKGVMGVCAGTIIMANKVDDSRIIPLKLMPFEAVRNHYGRQVHSFSANIKLNFSPDTPFPAIFIRAPKIIPQTTKKQLIEQACYQQQIIMLNQGKHCALSFHPELTEDSRIHQFWLNLQK